MRCVPHASFKRAHNLCIECLSKHSESVENGHQQVRHVNITDVFRCGYCGVQIAIQTAGARQQVLARCSRAAGPARA